MGAGDEQERWGVSTSAEDGGQLYIRPDKMGRGPEVLYSGVWLVSCPQRHVQLLSLYGLFLTKLSNMERSLSRVCSGGTIQMTVSLFLLEFHQWKERRCGDWVTVAKVVKQLRTASSDEWRRRRSRAATKLPRRNASTSPWAAGNVDLRAMLVGQWRDWSHLALLICPFIRQVWSKALAILGVADLMLTNSYITWQCL